MNNGFIDIHSHVVYGIDDGARNREESIRMLHAAYDDGTRVLVATPHVMPGIREFREREYRQRLEELQGYCSEQGLDLELLPGAEIFYTKLTREFLRDRRIPTLGGSEYVLVEFLPEVKYEEISAAVVEIQRAGYRPILAHVERYANLICSIKRMEELQDRYKVVLQMNCSSVLGGKGLLRDMRARKALEEELINVIASDAHNTTTRPPRMRAAYECVKKKYDPDYACALTGLRWEPGDAENEAWTY